MIVVIADDLSGAAELAGIAARYGYRAQVQTEFDPLGNADVIAIDTDTRWRSAVDAARIVGDVAASVVNARPQWIFKKTDSVLRGNVRAEIEAIRAITGHQRALLIPANPSKSRIIRNGTYLIDGVELHLTAFADDPEYPRRTSDVTKLANSNESLHIPDAVCVEDLESSAANVDHETLLAGGADFFEAVLIAKEKPRARLSNPPTVLREDKPILFVCGSAAAWDNGRAEQCAAFGIPLFSMPEAIFNGKSTKAMLDEWGEQTVVALLDHRNAMIAIGRRSICRSSLPSKELVDRLVDAAASIVATAQVKQICLEGGATAAAMIRRLGWTQLNVLPSELPGCAALSPTSDCILLVKPGSYPWPESILMKSTR